MKINKKNIFKFLLFLFFSLPILGAVNVPNIKLDYNKKIESSDFPNCFYTANLSKVDVVNEDPSSSREELVFLSLINEKATTEKLIKTNYEKLNSLTNKNVKKYILDLIKKCEPNYTVYPFPKTNGEHVFPEEILKAAVADDFVYIKSLEFYYKLDEKTLILGTETKKIKPVGKILFKDSVSLEKRDYKGVYLVIAIPGFRIEGRKKQFGFFELGISYGIRPCCVYDEDKKRVTDDSGNFLLQVDDKVDNKLEQATITHRFFHEVFDFNLNKFNSSPSQNAICSIEDICFTFPVYKNTIITSIASIFELSDFCINVRSELPFDKPSEDERIRLFSFFNINIPISEEIQNLIFENIRKEFLKQVNIDQGSLSLSYEQHLQAPVPEPVLVPVNRLKDFEVIEIEDVIFFTENSLKLKHEDYRFLSKEDIEFGNNFIVIGESVEKELKEILEIDELRKKPFMINDKLKLTVIGVLENNINFNDKIYMPNKIVEKYRPILSAENLKVSLAKK